MATMATMATAVTVSRAAAGRGGGGGCASRRQGRRGVRAVARAVHAAGEEGPLRAVSEDEGMGRRKAGLVSAAGVWAVAAGVARPGRALAEGGSPAAAAGAAAAAAAAAAPPPKSGTRPGVGGTEYYDVQDQFRITTPSAWVHGEGVAPGQMGVQTTPGTRRRVIVFADPAKARDVTASVTLTDLSPDYTGIGSFGGGAMEVATTLVGGLDQPDQGQVAKLLGYGDSGDGFVWCEYSLTPVEVRARSGVVTPPPAGVVPRHVLSLLATQRVGKWYNRLYSVNVSGTEAAFAKDGAKLRAILDSFALGDGVQSQDA